MDKLGQLSRKDVLYEQNSKGLMIFPFNEGNLKGASYDITPTIIAMSTATGLLETVYRDKRDRGQFYIYVKAKDTVLAVSNECLMVPPYIAGYVVSRVSKVAEGFGHVSTSIDPNWKGSVLIALSNPTNKPIRVSVGGRPSDQNPLATVSFHYLNTPCDEKEREEHQGMRMDLLDAVKYSNRRGIRAWLQRTLHPYRRKFTDVFISFYKDSDIEEVKEDKWTKFVNQLQGAPTRPNCEGCRFFVESAFREKRLPSDFVVNEGVFARVVHWGQRHKQVFKTIGVVVVVLVLSNCLPNEWKDKIAEILSAIKLLG